MPAPIPCEHAPKGCSDCREIRRKAQRKAWLLAHPNHQKEWYAKNQEAQQLRMRERYWKDPDKYREESRVWRLAFPEKHFTAKTGAIFRLSIKEMLEEQNYCCGACGDDISRQRVIDHDHVTKLVRGLLCKQCNSMLGMAGDRIPALLGGAEYLASSRGFRLGLPYTSLCYSYSATSRSCETLGKLSCDVPREDNHVEGGRDYLWD